MAATLKSLPDDYIAIASTNCFNKLKSLEQYHRSTNICCFLSMKNEMHTYGFIREALSEGKRIYIPKVTGPRPCDMIITELESFELIDSFPKSKWGIPEPPPDYLLAHPDVSSDVVLDLVVVPGVVFDKSGGRIGHGRGYYGIHSLFSIHYDNVTKLLFFLDCFLSKNQDASAAAGKPKAYTVGVAFDEQLTDIDVPMDSTDVYDLFLKTNLLSTIFHRHIIS